MTSLTSVIPKLYQEYVNKTPKKLKIIDAYLLYVFLTAVIQFVYCCLVGTFPFNSFLSGFISTVSSFVLGVCLRLQANPENKNEFQGLSAERGFADFIFAHLVLHIVVINFIEEQGLMLEGIAFTAQHLVVSVFGFWALKGLNPIYIYSP